MPEKIKIFVVAGVVIKKDGKFLLVQEKKLKARGLWNLPAGRVEIGDTIEQAAIREAKEETGYDVRLIRKLGVFHKSGDEAVKHVFEAEIVGGELSFSKEEILDVRWFGIEEINQMKDKLRRPWVLEAIGLLENKKKK